MFHVDERLTDRTYNIISKYGLILLKKDNWYLSCWTNIAAGIDHADWGIRESALEISDLKWAFAIAKLYDCKVIAFYPKRVKHEYKRIAKNNI